MGQMHSVEIYEVHSSPSTYHVNGLQTYLCKFCKNINITALCSNSLQLHPLLLRLDIQIYLYVHRMYICKNNFTCMVGTFF